MDICDLFPTPGSRHRRKRIGRGISAGQGKTCGRGHKGDKARGQSKVGFEGGQTPLQRRIPRRRGFTNVFKRELAEVNVSQLEVFDNGAVITPELILEKGLVRKIRHGLKILGDGALTKKLTVKANAFSKSAAAKIEAAGGKAEVLGAAVEDVEATAKKDEAQAKSEPETNAESETVSQPVEETAPDTGGEDAQE